MIDLTGGRTTYGYDAVGQFLKFANPQQHDGETTQYRSDAANRIYSATTVSEVEQDDRRTGVIEFV